jgi:hypothetical protein
MRNAVGIVIAVALGLGLGCKKKDEGGKSGDPAAASDKAAGGKSAGACDRRSKEGICGEYHGAAKADWIKQQCDAMGAPFVESCPKDGAIGRCVGEAGTPMEVHSVFYGPSFTKETFAMMCKAPMQPREP